MFKNRIQLVRKIIRRSEAVLITGRYNIKYLCGFTGSNAAILLTTEKALFFTDSRYLSEAKKAIPSFFRKINLSGLLPQILMPIINAAKIRKLFFEENDLRYSAYRNLKKVLRGIKLQPQNNMLENIRSTKDNTEIEIIKKAQKLTDKTFIELKKSLRAGQTEKEISWNLESIAHNLGADGLSFPPIIAIGKNSATPHHQTSTTRLKKGDMILIDMGLKYRDYCTDMTRMVFCGQPSAQEKEIYNLVLAAQQSAIKKIEAGMTGIKADLIARELFRTRKQDKKFLHSLGHGVGLQIHESPSLGPKSTPKIAKNSIITVEPGLYLKDRFGIRIEDMVIVGSQGNKILSGVPKTLESAIHKLI